MRTICLIKVETWQFISFAYHLNELDTFWNMNGHNLLSLVFQNITVLEEGVRKKRKMFSVKY